MISKYLSDLDVFISACPEIVEIDIIRRDFHDTGLEKVALYRYRLTLSDDSEIEISERLIEVRNKLEITKYRYHWQTRSGELIKRWDNAPHHQGIDTFPHHLHLGPDDNVVRYENTGALKLLAGIIETKITFSE